MSNFRLLLVGIFVLLQLSWASAESNKEKFKLGVIVPLSGDLAFFGNAHVNCAKLYFDAHPTNNIEIIYEDSSYDVKKRLLLRIGNFLL